MENPVGFNRGWYTLYRSIKPPQRILYQEYNSLLHSIGCLKNSVQRRAFSTTFYGLLYNVISREPYWFHPNDYLICIEVVPESQSGSGPHCARTPPPCSRELAILCAKGFYHCNKGISFPVDLPFLTHMVCAVRQYRLQLVEILHSDLFEMFSYIGSNSTPGQPCTMPVEVKGAVCAYTRSVFGCVMFICQGSFSSRCS